MQEKCCAKGCARTARYKKHKLCMTHYMRYRKHGTVGDKPIAARKVIKPYLAKSEENSINV